MLIQEPITTKRIIYPESDGKPMADNTKQFRYIATIENGLEALFANDPQVFVAGDLFWYPVEGDPKIRVAPDALVVFGRPKGDRGSYLQWLEDDIPPQVVFEILSPGNTFSEMHRKLHFYERFGVEEYYLYDPDDGELSGWIRRGDTLQEIENIVGWTSPRLGVRFELEDGELKLFRPDGEPFATFVEVIAQRDQARQHAEQERQRADQERQHAEQERQRADQARQHVEQERQRAEQERQRAEQERQRAEQAEARVRELAERLRALGGDPERE
ncbi:MAG: Uma2 family endonuclease [Chloroflexi bacterium]|nr:Uma2 family endonuclease [Chloroflexota bacterium]